MKYFLIPILMLVSKIALSQIMLPAYQGVVAKIPAGAVKSCPGLATVTDVDNNAYNTVLIGTQCWMASNLRVTKYNNGTLIPLDNSGGSTGDGSTETWTARISGALTVYAHSNGNLITYGYLYNWYAATDSREICPTGWHVPSDAEWTTLTTFLGGLTVAGGKMKSTGTTYWTSPNTGAENLSGFSALPGGVRFKGANGAFDWIRSFARFGSTSTTSTAAYFYQMDFDDINVTQGTCGKACGNSVRCLRD
jgi:uncharacterized protein (TIGR02145 family)